jgi:hypothetical protein
VTDKLFEVYLVPEHQAHFRHCHIASVHVVEDASVVVETPMPFMLIADSETNSNERATNRRRVGVTNEKFHVRFSVDARPFTLMIDMLATPSRVSRFKNANTITMQRSV